MLTYVKTATASPERGRRILSPAGSAQVFDTGRGGAYVEFQVTAPTRRLGSDNPGSGIAKTFGANSSTVILTAVASTTARFEPDAAWLGIAGLSPTCVVVGWTHIGMVEI